MRNSKILPSSSRSILEIDNLKERESSNESIENKIFYNKSELGNQKQYILMKNEARYQTRRRVRMNSLSTKNIFFTKQQQRLSISMNEVIKKKKLNYKKFKVTDSESKKPSEFCAQKSINVALLGCKTNRTRSLTYLEWVHEKQTKRMISRSEWFLGTDVDFKNCKLNSNSKQIDSVSYLFLINLNFKY